MSPVLGDKFRPGAGGLPVAVTVPLRMTAKRRDPDLDPDTRGRTKRTTTTTTERATRGTHSQRNAEGRRRVRTGCAGGHVFLL